MRECLMLLERELWEYAHQVVYGEKILSPENLVAIEAHLSLCSICREDFCLFVGCLRKERDGELPEVPSRLDEEFWKRFEEVL